MQSNIDAKKVFELLGEYPDRGDYPEEFQDFLKGAMGAPAKKKKKEPKLAGIPEWALEIPNVDKEVNRLAEILSAAEE